MGRNKERQRIAEAQYRHRKRESDPDFFKFVNLWKNYRLSKEDWTMMLIRQKNCCAICGVPFAREGPIDVDHCHRTKRVRGLLCRSCNTVTVAGIDRAISDGFFERAISYVVEDGTGKTLGAYRT